MANLFPTIVPGKILINRAHKIRIALSHNAETRYIITDIIVDSTTEFKNGVVVKRPDAVYLTQVSDLEIKPLEHIFGAPRVVCRFR